MTIVDSFILSKYTSMDVVLDAEAERSHVRIARKRHRSVRFGVVKTQDVTVAKIGHLFDGEVDFIVNIPATGIFQGEAIELCQDEGVGWGGLADSMRAVRYEEPYTYTHPAHSFVLPALRRHSHVRSVSFVDSRRLLVTRPGGLPPLVLYIEDTYQTEVTSVRFAIDRCWPFDIFVAIDPNAGPTRQAVSAAHNAGVEILRWGETLGRLRR
ncbi:hypothetical protein PY310_18820 [Pseudarthrobacter sp. H3Y2-7]|uniref:hypothetical protein n=1 Tax=Pseudarthrobacter naphthalenicus TaxID=3031328 RepID=UPI0023AEAA78|nr:hypothetical protein [Pseudarthrobacter sp. H3Y2-7]MDE8670636.1 hypothetical protein [Pseudarthrobacter sp. H3Y2-7]